MTLTYRFDDGAVDPAVLGGKGSSLARMSALGISIPPGFTIGTEAWRVARAEGSVRAGLFDEIGQRVAELGERLGQAFDDPASPLLVSVRSGAPVSMPGMMDTVLNLGLTDAIVGAMETRGQGDFARASYVRLLENFATIVAQVDEGAVGELRKALTCASNHHRVQGWKSFLDDHRCPLPQTGIEQLELAIRAVWDSWDSPRAQRYRAFKNIDNDLGTAVTVQAMVFGNRNERSGTGVVFTRDPASGEPGAYGDFLLNAQGEDVVDGSVTPLPVSSLKSLLPAAFTALEGHLAELERAYGDLCDVEFTIESDSLWILQVRPGQRSGAASVRIASDMVDEGLISVEAAIARVPVTAFEELHAPVLDEDFPLEIIGSGVAASPGVAVGVPVFDANKAEEMAANGEAVVLFRGETSPHDIAGMIAAQGIVTARGGRASHAAVVARGLGRPAVCGIDGLEIDGVAGVATVSTGERITSDDVVTIDGSTGRVLRGAARVHEPAQNPHAEQILEWCDSRAVLPVIDGVPDGFDVVRVHADLDGAGRDLAIDIEWEGAPSEVLLRSLISSLTRDGDQCLVFVTPESFHGSSLTLPEGPWVAVAAGPKSRSAARLLAATARTTLDGLLVDPIGSGRNA